MKKEKWYLHCDRDVDDHDCWTLTTNPEKRGWETDSAYIGYGLPKKVGKWICKQLNASNEICPFYNNGSNWIKRT